MKSRTHRILNMVKPMNDSQEEAQSSSIIAPSEINSSAIQFDDDDSNSIPDSQFSLDILNSDEENEEIEMTPPKNRIINKPSLVIQETDSDSDSSSGESSSSSSSSSSSFSRSSHSTDSTKDFSSDDSVKDPTYEDPFSENRKVQPDSDDRQLQAMSSDLQDFSLSAVENQELFNINSSPGVDNQPPSVDEQPSSVGEQPFSVGEQPSSVGEQSLCVDVESRKRSRKRKAEPLLWKRNQSKLLKNKGLSYTSMSKSKKIYDAKKMGPVCSSKCKSKCSTEFTFEERKLIFDKFWESGNLEIQRQFVHNHMKTVEPKYRYLREGTSRKNYNRAFYLTRNYEKTRVCKLFFMNTLAISDTFIRTVIKKQSETGVHLTDNRGKHDNHKTLDSELTDGVKAHINSIPRIESHYCRARSTREYIEGGLTVAALHRHYVDKCKSEGAPNVSYQVYYNIFMHDFNLSFWQPKKDQCEDCMAYQNAEDKSLLQGIYDEHLKQKTLARAEKDKDKELVSNSYVVAVYDLQAVMPCPRGDVSNFYYTSKLNLLNFTITELGTKDTTCYVWHEGEGARGINEIGSCVFMYLTKLNNNATMPCDVTFYSDNCCGQQKNKYMLAMYQYATQVLPNIKSVTHKFLVKGHTQNEGDSVHSVIQRNITRALKSSPIYVPDQYITLIKTAKKTGTPYAVKELTHENFFDIKPLCQGNYNIDDNGNKFKWTDIKILKVDKLSNGVFTFKTSYEEEEFRSVTTLRKRRTKSKVPDNDLTLKNLYTEKLSVPETKKQGILKLIEKNVIPKYYEPFYANL